MPGTRRRQPKQAGQPKALSRRAARIVIVLVACIFVPVVATLVLTTRASAPDLFDLTPVVARSDQYLILAWPELERARTALNAGGVSSGTMIRALGYMMEADRPIRDGERVQSFVLLPDAGNTVHPAHRFGDQMIDVRLEAGSEGNQAIPQATYRYTSWSMPGPSPRTRRRFSSISSRTSGTPSACRLTICVRRRIRAKRCW